MGGSITLASRFNDGETICIDAWTNFIPAMVLNSTTLSGDDTIVRQTMQEYLAQNKFTTAPLRKSGYGIVVIDFIEKEIHSIQEYTNFQHVYPASFLDFSRSGWFGDVFEHVLKDQLKQLLLEKRRLPFKLSMISCSVRISLKTSPSA